jgi:hypothetical protein
MFIRSEVSWLKEHARSDDSGVWWCKKTGAPILIADVGRSIHFSGLRMAGSGEVRTITHLACKKCEPNKVPPRLGTPILDSEIAESIET